MASIRKRKWETSEGEPREAWLVDYFDQSGKRHIKTFRRKKDAEDWQTETLFEVKQGTHTAERMSVTVGRAGSDWLEHCEARAQRPMDVDGLARSTLKQYRNHFRHHIKPFLGGVKLAQLSAPTVRKFEDKLRNEGRSATMVRKVVSTLGMLLADRNDMGFVSRNVVRERSRSRRTKKSRARKIEAGMNFPTPEEARAILQAATGRWRPLVATTIFTGMRMSELRGLTWTDVDFKDGKDGVIRVRQRADEWGDIAHPKSEAGERVIPMGAFLSNILKAWKLKCPKGELGLVFPNGRGNVENHANIYRRCFGAIQLKCGIVSKDGKPKYGPHAFRHYAISTFIDEGHPHKKVQVIAGHSTLSMTMDTYGHLFPDPEGDADMMRRAELRLIA